eukprot:906094-Pyramimonas_sp.AAC.1
MGTFGSALEALGGPSMPRSLAASQKASLAHFRQPNDPFNIVVGLGVGERPGASEEEFTRERVEKSEDLAVSLCCLHSPTWARAPPAQRETVRLASLTARPCSMPRTLSQHEEAQYEVSPVT